MNFSATPSASNSLRLQCQFLLLTMPPFCLPLRVIRTALPFLPFKRHTLTLPSPLHYRISAHFSSSSFSTSFFSFVSFYLSLLQQFLQLTVLLPVVLHLFRITISGSRRTPCRARRTSHASHYSLKLFLSILLTTETHYRSLVQFLTTDSAARPPVPPRTRGAGSLIH